MIFTVCTEFPVTSIVGKFDVDTMTILALAIFLIISKSVGAEETHFLQLEPKNGSVRLGDGFRFYLTVRDPLANENVLFSRKGSFASFCIIRLGTGIQIKKVSGYACGIEVSEDGTMRYFLQIENVSLNDLGTWYCQLGLRRSNYGILDVKYADLRLEPKNGSVRLGDRFRFYLTMGDPLAKGNMMFRRSTETYCSVRLDTGIQINNIDGYTCGREVSEDGTMRYYLQIQNVSLNDSGTWYCQLGLNTSNNVILDVKYAPTITLFGHQTNIIVKETEQVKLRCEADSNPPPTLTIQKSKGHNPVYQIQNSDVKNLTYLFTAECNSSGTYVCSARNSLGNSPSREVQLNVKCRPRPANSQRLIFAGVKGNDVNMKVSVISYPKPVFVLQNCGGHVLDRDQNPDYDGYLATGSTTLRINQNTDFGNYSIVVKNTEGEFVFTATIRAQSSATHSTSAGLTAGVTISLIVLIALIAIAVFLTRKGFRCVLLRPDEREQTSNVYDDLTHREAGKQTYESLKIYQNAAALRANAKKQ